MSKKVLLITIGAAGAVLLSGCEIILPIIAATQGGGSSGPSYYDDPYYGDYYDYGDSYPYRYERLNVQIEELSGRLYGTELSPTMGGVAVEGHHSGASAQFALTVAEDAELDEPPAPSADDLFVSLDVCPIEDYASGLPIPDPSGFVYFTVCRAGDCLSSFDGQLEVEVVEDEDGRRVVARSTWPDGNTVALRVHYTVDGSDGSVAPYSP